MNRWLYHPHLTEDLYLFFEDTKGWYFLDEESGQRIITVDRDEVHPIQFPLN